MTAKCEGLSPRELEVIGLLMGERSHAEIARIMGISVWTVKRHLENARLEMGVMTNLGLVVKLIKLGLVKPEPEARP